MSFGQPVQYCLKLPGSIASARPADTGPPLRCLDETANGVDPFPLTPCSSSSRLRARSARPSAARAPRAGRASLGRATRRRASGGGLPGARAEAILPGRFRQYCTGRAERQPGFARLRTRSLPHGAATRSTLRVSTSSSLTVPA
jgi:hypothetical protein